MIVPWLGPSRWHGPPGVRWSVDEIDPDTTLVSMWAERDLTGIATGTFGDLVAGFRFDPPGVDGVRAAGFGCSEFGLPARSDGTFRRWTPLLPNRPASVLPVVLVGPDGDAVLLAPVEGVHEQCFPADEHGPAWGWHGDLDQVAAGFGSTLAVIRGTGPRACFDRWAALIDRGPAAGVDRRYRDALGSMPSYWTDNGAAYWYRTEPGHTVASGIAATVADLRERGMPVGAVQLDSWWYPHQALRPFDTDEWLVPPTGLLRWEPRDDVFPDGIAPLRSALGDPPLVAHCRHLSASSPYVDEVPCWVDGEQAHPATAELYQRWMDQCVAWGIETFEHDWLVECFAGVRQLRGGAGRVAAWQDGVHDAAARRGLTLQWCMPTPADMIHAARLPAVTSVRTSGDHGYLVSPGFLWGWSLLTGAMARALGLVPFKDVFHSGSEHADVEALLSTLTCGPVGVGDRLGAGRPEVVAPCHRADGRLVKPDVTIAAFDRCFSSAWPFSRRAHLIAGEARTLKACGEWWYVLACNPREDGPASGTLTEDELGNRALLWDWRAGEFVDVSGGWPLELPALGWAYGVLPPVLAGGRVAVLGDPALHATAGDARLGEVHDDGDRVRATVVGAAGERFELVVWVDGDTRRIPVEVPARGWTVVEVG